MNISNSPLLPFGCNLKVQWAARMKRCHEPLRRGQRNYGNVSRLREELDKADFDKQQQVQNAIASQQNEINHFKRMVTALRSEIDQTGNLHEEKMQRETQLKTTEFKELQETIIELRAELEKTNAR